jgi:NAD+ synthetase
MSAELKPINDYFKVFNHLIKQTSDYICNNNLKCMVLGISGGIDSTVVAAICHEVSKRTGIPLIGRSLPTQFNKEGETNTADLVGKAFCSSYKEVSINLAYRSLLSFIGTMEDSMLDLSGNTLYDIQGEFPKQQTDLANGNIQARLRMIYLYNLASIHKGLVIDTDNLTENNLGYFTIHGDVGDFNPIGGLWKTEVFELAEWLFNQYKNNDHTYLAKAEALWASLQLKPTAGLGITNNDLEELGAESYDQVDSILQEILAWKQLVVPESINFKNFMDDQQILNIPYEIVENVAKRHFTSEFKRKQLPIKIQRQSFIDKN